MRVIGVGDNVVDDYRHARTLYPGGNALNFAVFARMLDSDAAYLGLFGSDAAAEHLQDTLDVLGIDRSRCRTADGPSGRATWDLEDGQRIFVESNGGGVSRSFAMDFVLDDPEYLQSFSILHTSTYSHLDQCLARFQSLGLPVSYDFSDDFDQEYALSICRYLDFGFFSCAGWPVDSVRELLQGARNQGCGMSVATRGPEDVLLFDGEAWFEQPAGQAKPRDTLGAGDAFITAFLVSCASGKQIPVALERGAAFAAEVCQLPGAFGHGQRY